MRYSDDGVPAVRDYSPGVWVWAEERFTRIMLLDDAEAALAGIDRWRLLADELAPIMFARANSL
jgi:hypothetical protein